MDNCYIDEIEYATSFYEKTEAREIIRTFDDINHKFKIIQYEGMFLIEIISKETKKFLGYYAD